MGRCFSQEHGPAGRRSFIIADYASFWQHYAAMPAPERHYYEIIREGCPCHLYFGAHH